MIAGAVIRARLLRCKEVEHDSLGYGELEFLLSRVVHAVRNAPPTLEDDGRQAHVLIFEKENSRGR